MKSKGMSLRIAALIALMVVGVAACASLTCKTSKILPGEKATFKFVKTESTVLKAFAWIGGYLIPGVAIINRQTAIPARWCNPAELKELLAKAIQENINGASSAFCSDCPNGGKCQFWTAFTEISCTYRPSTYSESGTNFEACDVECPPQAIKYGCKACGSEKCVKGANPLAIGENVSYFEDKKNAPNCEPTSEAPVADF